MHGHGPSRGGKAGVSIDPRARRLPVASFHRGVVTP